jgi:hypothetical protein
MVMESSPTSLSVVQPAGAVRQKDSGFTLFCACTYCAAPSGLFRDKIVGNDFIHHVRVTHLQSRPAKAVVICSNKSL